MMSITEVKKLVEDIYDLMDQINKFYSKKKDLQVDTAKESLKDPSEELPEIWDKVKECDPLTGLIFSKLNEDATNEEATMIHCKFYSKGFCKHGSLCSFSHSSLDCKDHTENGKCDRNNCPDRHRDVCKFYNSRRGCTRNSNCAFLHRGRKNTREENNGSNSNSSQYGEKIKQLENSIAVMTNEIHNKDMIIERNKKDLEKLKSELEQKDVEIQEKDKLIRSLEDDDYEQEEDDNDSTDDSDEEDLALNESENKSKMIGPGHFGKQFEVRKGMEEEADILRKEWRRNKNS